MTSKTEAHTETNRPKTKLVEFYPQAELLYSELLHTHCFKPGIAAAVAEHFAREQIRPAPAKSAAALARKYGVSRGGVSNAIHRCEDVELPSLDSNPPDQSLRGLIEQGCPNCGETDGYKSVCPTPSDENVMICKSCEEEYVKTGYDAMFGPMYGTR